MMVKVPKTSAFAAKSHDRTLIRNGWSFLKEYECGIEFQIKTFLDEVWYRKRI